MSRTRPETMPRGERHGMAKMTEESVRQLRADYETGDYSQDRLAVKYGIGQSIVSSIIRRRTWRHVA